MTGRLFAALDALAQSAWPRPGVIPPQQAAHFTYYEGEPDAPDPLRSDSRAPHLPGADGELVLTTHAGGARAGDTAGRPDTEVPVRDPVDVMVEVGLTEALSASRMAHARVQVFRPLPMLDERAFDVALGVFHRAYVASYRPVLPSDAEEAHNEATRDALEAAFGAYEETRR